MLWMNSSWSTTLSGMIMSTLDTSHDEGSSKSPHHKFRRSEKMKHY